MAAEKRKLAGFDGWWAARVVVDRNAETTHNELFRDYRANVIGEPLGAQGFVLAMNRKKVPVVKRVASGVQAGYRTGVRLRHVPAPSAGDLVVDGSITAAKVEVPANRMDLTVAWEHRARAANIGHELAVEHVRAIAKGRTPELDDQQRDAALPRAAAAYAFAASIPAHWWSWLISIHRPRRDPAGHFVLDVLRNLWPFDLEAFRPGLRRRMLVKAGSIVIAAIAKHDRDIARGGDEVEAERLRGQQLAEHLSKNTDRGGQ